MPTQQQMITAMITLQSLSNERWSVPTLLSQRRIVSRPRPNAVIIPADIPLEEQQRIFEDLLRKAK